MVKYILASGSPRRKELLEQIGLEFEIMVAQGEESTTKQTPWEIVEELSLQKATEIADKNKGNNDNTLVVIGADTIVAYGNEIMGKPKDREDAIRMLTLLQNNVHQVYTGVTIIIANTGKKLSFYEKTQVYMYPMNQAQIEEYVDMSEPTDKADVAVCNTQYSWEGKAGGYGIQDAFGKKYIKKIEGDYYNVVGLPVSRVYQELVKLNSCNCIQ